MLRQTSSLTPLERGRSRLQKHSVCLSVFIRSEATALICNISYLGPEPAVLWALEKIHLFALQMVSRRTAMSPTTVILLCPVHSKRSYVWTQSCTQGANIVWKGRKIGEVTENSICACESTSQHNIQEQSLCGILLFVRNKTTDDRWALSPEHVPTVSQNKQSFSNKIIMDVFCFLTFQLPVTTGHVSVHTLHMTALCLTPSPPLVQWLETQQAEATLRNTELYCQARTVQWPFYALANTALLSSFCLRL